MSDLPRDILTDILSRLPAKSLGQFKSVSKYWLSLISSADFIKLHHRRALFDTNTNHSRVFIISTYSLHSVNFESPSCYEGVDDDDAKAIINLNDPLEKRINPLTPFSDGTRFYGLGYDFSINDYKMVRVSRSSSSNSVNTQVFNLKAGLWRTVQPTHMNINEPDEIGSFSNSAIHWIVRHMPHDGNFNKRETILSFDIKDEVFGEIVLPNGGENEESGFRCLGDLRGCLYAVYGGSDGVDMNVWVMKEYGVESSWSKVIKLDWFRFNCDYGMTPVCFTEEDDVVLDLDSWDGVRFNLKDNTIKRFKKCSTDWHFWVVKFEAMSNLPRDILTDILSRLPAKSVGQFKSVSKYWFSLISSADFIKLHHRRVLSDTNTNHSRVFIMSTHSLHSVNYESPSCYEGVNDDDDAKAIISLNDPLEKESVGEKELGSCYGLIFFVCYNDCILLWNPTTQKTRIIPDPITPFFDGTRFYGLGYDFSIDDYKMVRATRSSGFWCLGDLKGCLYAVYGGDGVDMDVWVMKEYGVESSWNDVFDFDSWDLFLNGALHWAANGDLQWTASGVVTLSFNWRIISLDLATETYGEVLQPVYDEGDKDLTLESLRERLCVLCNYRGFMGDEGLWSERFLD
ncbi:hypothetical protein L1987_67302 [Smallanthus sonchifolius]|uniref:Uncharacterized protein n=1 Tax=Smallanthus sonchifolius TaxID=185202 RepID=A0ACB9B1P9_9ASTR|nr:hypothetical protein L1987_67302 [Smallanthus sonchifolius]